MDDHFENDERGRREERPLAASRYTRETMRGGRRHPRRAQKEEQPPRVMQVQLVICVLAVLVVLAVGFAGGAAKQTVRQAVAQALNSSVGKNAVTDGVRQAFAAVKAALPDLHGIFATASGDTVSAGSSGQPSGSSGASSGQASSSGSASGQSSASGASSGQASATGASATGTSSAQASAVSTAGSQTLNGAGGEDASVQVVDGRLVPPVSASLAPYLLSARPVWPLAVQGRVSSPFGFRVHPITKEQSFHMGMDIAAPKDTLILAALPGTVKQTGRSSSYGNYALLDHGGGVQTFYAHCDTVTAAQGQPVKAGEAIAKVGTTGLSTGYHLHFELRIGGVSVDPARALGRSV